MAVAEEIGYRLCLRGWTGRSGGASGMDSAFMKRFTPEQSVIYRPDGKQFPGRCVDINTLPQHIIDECIRIAESMIPWYEYLDFGSRMLHARNALQVLGDDLQTPSRVVLYWANENHTGFVSGGTRTAVALARKHGIPTANLRDDQMILRWTKQLGIDYKIPFKVKGLSFLE
jgi:hypothetical protein